MFIVIVQAEENAAIHFHTLWIKYLINTKFS